jgi:hypothetical protein
LEEHGNSTPKRKSVTLGAILAVFGLCAIALAIVVNPLLQENKDVLRVKEFYGVDTPGDHRVVATQTMIVLGGLLAGGPLLLVGIVIIALAMSYNNKLDAILLSRSSAPQTKGVTAPPDEPVFCAHCGQPTEGKPYCVYCGKKASP